MNNFVRISLCYASSFLAATAADARGPSPQPWLMYPVKAMENCRMGTAPPKIAARCDDLLATYARELEACVPMRRGGSVQGAHQVALEQTNPDCAAAAAVVAAGRVK